MRNRFDQLAKQSGQEALGPSGLTVAHDEISPDAQHADLRHEPDPAREAERACLGLLGRLAAILCLIEIYGHAPGAEEFRACLGKHIAFWQQRARKARRKKKQQQLRAEPFLWIIAAGSPTAVLTGLKFDPAPEWPKGVYFLSDILRVGIVVASELPRDRESLLVRVMAAGPLLPRAIEDLSALPADAHERTVASQILLNLQHALDNKPNQTPEEQEFIVSMQNIVERLRKEGHDKGRLAGVRLSLRRVLALRKLVPNRTDEARIEACTDLPTLERWLDQALTAQNVAEALWVGAGGATNSVPPRHRKSRSSA
jgi:hypothetical protein